MIYLSAEELTQRDGEVLPLSADGTVDLKKVTAALEDASSVVRMYIPSLVGDDGEHLAPPPRLGDSLKPIVRDLAIYYLTRVTGGEDARLRYEASILLLKQLSGGGKSAGADGDLMLDRPDGAEVFVGGSDFLRNKNVGK